jgi:hypothetical protein
MGRSQKYTADAGDNATPAPAGGLTIHIGDLVTTASDRTVLEAAARALSDAEMPAVLLANFDVGRQIDLVIATEHQVLLVEAKGNQTPVRGQGPTAPRIRPLARAPVGGCRSAARSVRRTKHVWRCETGLPMFLGSSLPYFPGAVIFAPQVPQGSEIPAGDFKVRICDLIDLRTWVRQGNGLVGSEPGAISRICRRSRLAQGVRHCRSLRRQPRRGRDVGRYVSEHIPRHLPEQGRRAHFNTMRRRHWHRDISRLREAVAAGGSIALICRSGCGKTLAACRSGMLAAERGRVPIFIGAKDFEGEFGRLLNRDGRTDL